MVGHRTSVLGGWSWVDGWSVLLVMVTWLVIIKRWMLNSQHLEIGIEVSSHTLTVWHPLPHSAWYLIRLKQF